MQSLHRQTGKVPCGLNAMRCYGLRINEIAELTDAPARTVMTRVHKARHRLRGLLADVARARGYSLNEAA